MSTLTPPAAAPERPTGTNVVVVRPEAEVLGRQCLPYFLGVSAASTGATGISMNLVIIPPGGRPSRTATAASRPPSSW